MDIVDKRTNCAFIQYVFPKESLLWTFSVLLFPSITTADQRSESSDVARTGFTNCYAILRANIDLLWFYFEPCLSVFDIIWGYCRQLSVSHPFSGCSLSQWFYQIILNQQLDSRYILIFPPSRKRTIDLIFVDSLGEAVITHFLLWHIWQEFANIKPFSARALTQISSIQCYCIYLCMKHRDHRIS